MRETQSAEELGEFNFEDCVRSTILKEKLMLVTVHTRTEHSTNIIIRRIDIETLFMIRTGDRASHTRTKHTKHKQTSTEALANIFTTYKNEERNRFPDKVKMSTHHSDCLFIHDNFFLLRVMWTGGNGQPFGTRNAKFNLQNCYS